MPEPSAHPLVRVGWCDRVHALSAPFLERGFTPARVVGVERGSCRVTTGAGELLVPVPDQVVGDWIVLDGHVLVEALPRWSELARLDAEGRRQVLASNADVVLVAAPADRLSPARVEREVVIAWESGARPVVVLTKHDLASPSTADDLASRLVTVDVLPTSTVDGTGLDALRALLVHPTTGVLLGPSGAGKSTLVNALLGEDRLAVGRVRATDQRGRHTTSSRRLVPLPSGGTLVDMPGLRSLGLDAGDDAVAAAFRDVDVLARGCRFADCSHDTEPDCAVRAAVEHGELEWARLDSFRKLAREAAFEQRRADPVARAEQAKVWKSRTKELRRVYRERDR